MKALVASLTAGTLLLLSALHIYWAAGGSWGKDVAVPRRDAELLFRPSTVATLVVALLLAAAAALVAGRMMTWENSTIDGLVRWGVWTLAAIFALRAVGDFRWVGFFKGVRGTPFARLDTTVYSPLCLVLSAGCLYMATH